MEKQKHGIGYAKNYKRLHPNSYRNTIANRIINKLMLNKAVEIVYLSGSTVNGGTDDFSDIDFCVVVKNPKEFRKQLLLFLNSIGVVVHSFTPPNLSNILVIFLNDLTKIDFGVYSREEFQTKKCIVRDREAVIKGKVDFTKSTNKQKKDNCEKGKEYLAMGLADLIAIPREIYRKNIYEARANLDDARRHIAIYINLINNDIYHDYSNFTQYLNKAKINIFHKSLKNNDTYTGILGNALLLLDFIKGLKVYEFSLIKTIKEHLRINSLRIPSSNC